MRREENSHAKVTCFSYYFKIALHKGSMYIFVKLKIPENVLSIFGIGVFCSSHRE